MTLMSVWPAAHTPPRELLVDEDQARRAGRHQRLEALVAGGRKRTLAAVGLVHALRRIPQSAAITWWVFYTEREHGPSPARIVLFVVLAYGICSLGTVACGWCMERFGRRPTAVAGLAAGLGCTVVFFQASDPTVDFIAILGAMLFGLGLTPVTSAVSTEPLPSEGGGPVPACVRNGFDIVGTVLAPLAVGALGDHRGGPIGNSVGLLAMLWLPVAYLVCRHLPEAPGLRPRR
jgi:MFS family permease